MWPAMGFNTRSYSVLAEHPPLQIFPAVPFSAHSLCPWAPSQVFDEVAESSYPSGHGEFQLGQFTSLIPSTFTEHSVG